MKKRWKGKRKEGGGGKGEVGKRVRKKEYFFVLGS